MTQMTDTSLRTAAWVAGIAILVMTVAASIATDASIGNLMVANDAAATSQNILSSQMLFRIGVFSWLVILIADAFAAWGLYVYFKPVNNGISLLSGWLRMAYVAMLAVAMLNYVDVLTILNNSQIFTGAGQERMQNQIMLGVQGFQDMWSIGLIVFAIHILLIGKLILKSVYVPKSFGYILIIAFVGYLVINVGKFFFPTYSEIIRILEWIFILPMLGEVALGIWLVVRGVKVKLVQ